LGLVSVIVLSADAAGKNSITDSASASAILKPAFIAFVWASFKTSHFQGQGKM
jgi:hypothetical protein